MDLYPSGVSADQSQQIQTQGQLPVNPSDLYSMYQLYNQGIAGAGSATDIGQGLADAAASYSGAVGDAATSVAAPAASGASYLGPAVSGLAGLYDLSQGNTKGIGEVGIAGAQTAGLLAGASGATMGALAIPWAVGGVVEALEAAHNKPKTPDQIAESTATTMDAVFKNQGNIEGAVKYAQNDPQWQSYLDTLKNYSRYGPQTYQENLNINDLTTMNPGWKATLATAPRYEFSDQLARTGGVRPPSARMVAGMNGSDGGGR